MAEILREDRSTMQLIFTGLTMQDLALLRQYIMSYVPSIAIYQVKINTNTSDIQDPTLSLRIAQTPIGNLIAPVIPFQSECTTEPSECSFKYILDVSADRTIRQVTGKDLKLQRNAFYNQYITDPDWEPLPDSNYFIALLQPGQSIRLEADARKGMVSRVYNSETVNGGHTIYQSATLVRFQAIPTVVSAQRNDPRVKECQEGLIQLVKGFYRVQSNIPECQSLKMVYRSKRTLFTFEVAHVVPPVVVLLQGLDLLIDKKEQENQKTDTVIKIYNQLVRHHNATEPILQFSEY